MGDLVKREPDVKRRWSALTAATVIFLALACSSSGSRSVATTTMPPVRESSPTAPVAPPPIAIESIDLTEGAPGMRVDLAASGPLVWTSYRTDEGKLVVELPNSVPGAAVPSTVPGSGLVASIAIDSENNNSRPLTRLTVVTTGAVEHSLVADGNVLHLELNPVQQQGIESEAPAALAYEPVPEQPAAPAPTAGAAPAYAEPPHRAQVDLGTLENPHHSPPPTGPLATRLEAIEALDNGTVRVAGDGEFSYSTFRLEGPERFVIDLNGVINAAPASTVPVNGSLVRRVRTAQFKPMPQPVSRVVFDLEGPAWPEIDRAAHGLTVRFVEPEAVASGVAVSSPSPEPSSPELSSPEPSSPPQPVSSPEPAYVAPAPAASRPEPAYVPPAPEEEPEMAAAPSVVPAQPVPMPARIEPPRPAAERAPRRPPPTNDLAAYVAEVTTAAPVESEGPVDRVFTTKTFGARTMSGQERTYSGDTISMTLRDADLVETLRSFAAISGLSVVIQPEVKGSVTVELNNVPWDQALEQILRVNRLGYELEGTVMRIAPVKILKDEAKEQQELMAAKALQVPLKTIMRRLSYGTARDVATLLAVRGGILSQRGSVWVDKRTNSLIIKELPEYMDTVTAVINELDTPEPQVMIEARIVETTKRFTRSLGVQWAAAGEASPRLGNTTGLVFPNNVQGQGGVNLITGARNGFLNLSLGNVLNSFNLDLNLQAAESEGLIRILSAPKVAVLNNEEAEIQSGLQIPVQTITNNTVTTQFVKATLSLQVTPHVTAEGTVLMELEVRKREPQLAFAVAGANNAPIATKEARTRVIVRDGGTTVIGGIYKVTSDQGQDRVPGLANIPIIGEIFKNRRRTDENEELLIFITPRVVNL